MPEGDGALSRRGAGLTRPPLKRPAGPVDTHGVSHSVRSSAPKAPSSLVFAPEAHRPRHHRLVVDGTGVVFEVGVGVRHRLGWAECDAVLRFQDRIELIVDGATSVVVRAQDWYDGSGVLSLADRVVPPTLLITLDGDPEPDPTPYVLAGVAAVPAPVVAGAAGLATTAATASLVGGLVQRSAPLLLAAVALAWAVLPLVQGLRRRIAVPSRWRASAAVSGPRRVRLDHLLSRMPAAVLRRTLLGAPLLALVGAACWYRWSGGLPGVLPVAPVVLGVVLTLVAAGAVLPLGVLGLVELRRRRSRRARRVG